MASSTAFVGSVPENYHRYLRPLLFEPYARDLASRARVPARGRVLETACGTGIVTRHLAEAMPPDATLVATDLNEAMVRVAERHVAERPAAPGGPRGTGAAGQTQSRLRLQVADAQALPFDDASFDLVVCQFGVMFFPDKPRATREARRVLRDGGGRLIFNVWDSLAHNPMTAAAAEACARLFPSNPPDFFNTPFGWHDRAEIERVVRGAGFTRVSIQPVTFPSVSPSAEDAARGLLEGTPLAAQLQERGVTDVAPVRRAVAEALASRFGSAPCASAMRALVVEAA